MPADHTLDCLAQPGFPKFGGGFGVHLLQNTQLMQFGIYNLVCSKYIIINIIIINTQILFTGNAVHQNTSETNHSPISF